MVHEATTLITDEERKYLRKRLHSPEMQCQQCDIVRRLLEGAEQVDG